MVQANISWITLLYDGRSLLEEFSGKTVLEWVLDAGIIPIARYQTTKLPKPFQGDDIVAEMAEIYNRYNLKPLIIPWNEPGDPRGWKDNKVPADWWNIFVPLWKDAAIRIINAGGYPGFPDGPDYNFTTRNPFQATLDIRWIWDQELAWYSGHFYGLGREIDHPTNKVCTEGTPIDYDEYEYRLDDLRDYQEWWDPDIATMNQLRVNSNWMNPNPVLWDGNRSDYTACWWAWKLVDFQAQEILGKHVEIIATEGGWTPKARAGTPVQDRRWPLHTPKMIGRKTIQAFNEIKYTPYFYGATPWIMATDDMGGGGWPDDCWHGWTFSDVIDRDTGQPYGRIKPVLKMLSESPDEDLEVALSLLDQSLERIDQSKTIILDQ
jgi:hypothetical protein